MKCSLISRWHGKSILIVETSCNLDSVPLHASSKLWDPDFHMKCKMLSQKRMSNSQFLSICFWYLLKHRLHLQCMPFEFPKAQWALLQNPLKLEDIPRLCTFLYHIFLPVDLLGVGLCYTPLCERPSSLATPIVLWKVSIVKAALFPMILKTLIWSLKTFLFLKSFVCVLYK